MWTYHNLSGRKTGLVSEACWLQTRGSLHTNRPDNIRIIPGCIRQHIEGVQAAMSAEPIRELLKVINIMPIWHMHQVL
jgi:hypothetical protein